MTQREFFEGIANTEGMAVEFVDYANEAITKLDIRNEKRKAQVSKKALENAPLYEAILNLLEKQDLRSSEIAEALGISVQKASSLCVRLEADKKVIATDVKVKGKGKQKSYSLAE